MSKNVKELMNQLMEFDMDTPIENIQEELGLLTEATATEEHSVKSVLTDLIETSKPLSNFYVDGKDVYVAQDYKNYVYQRVLTLVDILGIELEGGR